MPQQNNKRIYLIEFIHSEGFIAWQLIAKHARAIAVTCFATFIMIIMSTPLLQKWGLSFDRHSNSFLYYGLLPLLFITLITRKNPLQLGIGLGNYRFWLPAVLIYLVITLPCVYLSSYFFPSVNQYYAAGQFDFWQYASTTAIYMLGWEYFFRGFMLQGLKSSLKEGAILIQMIPFTLLHFGKPEVEIVACIIAGIVWGYICYKGNSFWPAFIMHIAVNLLLKAAVVGLI